MQVHQRPIFRQRALHHHLYGREKDILPHFMALPVPVLLWLLFGLLFAAAALAWTTEIPTYTVGPGLVLDAEASSERFQLPSQGAFALIFFPWEAHQRLRPGQPVQITLPATNLTLNSHIARILPGVTSPATACTYYTTANSHQASSPVTHPSVAVLVPLGQQLSASIYAGTGLTAQVQTGFTRLINLLPGVGMLSGGQGAL
ncbi:hypothetical protein [Thermogemmatispora tikiterensis]|uniref:Uncharacterized protein n=1 Tax=Thermogemmatispora tikiterensis TaxID=1825093 RepID=A0A328VKA0_9CHLR|nr:hypothetical protein [Thermogemmatispora tikiterensis]RAQ95544.1 hypothetical protein A4R35_08350 [Thermogemmatispora tikiterensis]